MDTDKVEIFKQQYPDLYKKLIEIFNGNTGKFGEFLALYTKYSIIATGDATTRIMDAAKAYVDPETYSWLFNSKGENIEVPVELYIVYNSPGANMKEIRAYLSDKPNLNPATIALLYNKYGGTGDKTWISVGSSVVLLETRNPIKSVVYLVLITVVVLLLTGALAGVIMVAWLVIGYYKYRQNRTRISVSELLYWLCFGPIGIFFGE
jgi:uncharacterized protein YneF (UPF0154 family)